MAKLVQVRELRNQATRFVRDAEHGATLIVTRRGKPVATLKKFEASDAAAKPKRSSAWDHLTAQIEKRNPDLRTESPVRIRGEFERLTAKSKRKMPFKTWQEADRWAKGDRSLKQ